MTSLHRESTDSLISDIVAFCLFFLVITAVDVQFQSTLLTSGDLNLPLCALGVLLVSD